MRLAWYFMGGGVGERIYLAGGTTIDVTEDQSSLDIQTEQDIDLAAQSGGLDVAQQGTDLDLTDDRDDIDISG